MGVVYVSVMCCNKIKPVGITKRTARWLFINCLAVLLIVAIPKDFNLWNNRVNSIPQYSLSIEEFAMKNQEVNKVPIMQT